MKRYHECAIVKDGNERVGYFVTDVQGMGLRETLYNLEWNYLPKENFEQLVKNGEVQYLVWDNGVKCRYDKEEATDLVQCGISLEELKESEQEYFSMDCAFKMRHVNLAFGNPNLPAVACCIGEITQVFKINYILIYIVGDSYKIQGLCNEIKEKIRPLLNTMRISRNNNVIKMHLPVKTFLKILGKLNTQFLINTSTLKYRVENKKKGLEIPLAALPVSDNTKLEIIKVCENYTKEAERWLHALH